MAGQESVRIVPSEKSNDAWFEPTRWTLILQVQGDEDGAREALGKLLEAYRIPLIRAAVWEFRLNQDQAEELVQGFFAWVVEKEFVNRASEEKGRFRTFILRAMKRFHWHELERRRALKRGGETEFIPAEIAAEELAFDPETEKAVDREWARATFQSAMGRVEREFAARGKLERFQTLASLAVSGEGGYAGSAAQAGMTEGHLAVEISRFRSALRTAFARVVRDTVSSRTDAADETSYLVSLLSLS